MTQRFIQLTDHHLGRDAATINRGYATAWALERVLDAIAAGDHGADGLDVADFLLCTGDLVDAGDDAEYAHARGLYGVTPSGAAPGPLVSARPGLVGLPVYLVPGNHDPRAAWARNLFPATVPAERLHLDWRVGEVQYVFLDLGTGGRAGVLHDDALAFLDAVLARGGPTVLVLHHHPVPVGIPWLDRALPEGIDRLWARLRGGRVLGVLFGHAHASLERRVEGVPVLGLRATCFQFAVAEQPSFVIQPLHYRVVTIDDAGLTSRLYEVPLTGAAEGVPLA